MKHMANIKVINERGFSLIELRLVLFITFSVISMAMKLSFDHIATFIDEQIQYESQLKIREAQFLAYANNEDFYVTSLNGRFSLAQSKPENIYFEQYLPKDVQLKFTRGKYPFPIFVIRSTMIMNGIVGINIESERGNQKYTLNVGKGRFTYAKQQ